MRAPEIAFPALLQDFFLQRLIAQRAASAQTIASYRDAFELLLRFAERSTKRPASALKLPDLDAPLVLDFLDHLERGEALTAYPQCTPGGTPFVYALRLTARSLRARRRPARPCDPDQAV